MAFYKTCNYVHDARTNSYRFTVESKSDLDLAGLKQDISIRNRGIRQYAREAKEKYGTDRAMLYLKNAKLERVKLMARGPRSYWAKKNNFHPRFYDQSLPHHYATYFDVYVHTDWTNQHVLETEIREGLTPGQQAAIRQAEYNEAMFACQQARMLREKYGIVSYTRPGKRTEYKNIKDW